MDIITTKAPSRGIIDSHVITTGKTEAFFDGKVEKETIVVKGINYNYSDVVINNDPFLAKIIIKTKLKLGKDYQREFNHELNTINSKQEGLEKDCFAGANLNIIAEKITFAEPQQIVEIKLKPKLKGKVQSDETTISFAGKLCQCLTIGVGLCVNTDGLIEHKKNTLKIANASYIEIFIKVITGHNPISKKTELDVQKVLQNTRDQLYLLESELYDVLKMKHLMDVQKHKLGD